MLNIVHLDPMRFDLIDLRLFLAVVDAGSITHGAAEVGLSLPAASERLRDMEAVGRIRLLERGRRGVSPTEAGDALAHHARLILRQMARMRGELGEHAKGLRKTIRILANTAALTEFLPERLAPWMAARPTIDVELKERQSTEIARAVSLGLADMGVLSAAVDTGGLSLQPFATDRLVVLVPRHHELAASKSIFFADIVDQYFVGLTHGALQDHLDAQAARIGARLKMRVRARTFEGICRMAAHGVGLGIVPQTAARRYVKSGEAAWVRLADDWATRRLSVCTHSEDELTPPARDLLQYLADNSSALPLARHSQESSS
ncbi:LysR family transcriptional regulator [Agaricicola taiwanensis]|uniref:LysR family transcriptional regulator n=1 Tax=Agaricicola taiwanensis TaxID=591372 RepID=A0A8J2YG11_9RHOB|nr:LysR family transcriptional regulator [Agaricicola taiwanensis]GGE31780.1 LysR family transcriptional regulator [Agaricicola taiwanensis]